MSDFDFGGAFANTQKTLQETSQAAESHPLEMQHLRATTRASNAYADLADNKVKAEKNMQDIMGGLTLDPKASQSATMMQLAGASMKAGDAVTARELMARAAQAQTQEARILEYTARQKTAETTLHLKQADRYTALMSGVKTKQDFDAANAIFEREFGEKPPQPDFDPRIVKVLQDSAIKARDKIYQEHAKAMEGLARAREADMASYHREEIGLRKGELERKKERDKVLDKNGGKDIGAPTKGEIDAAGDVIAREGKGKGMSTEGARSAAFDLASRARALRKQNPGLSAGEAHQRAFVEQVEDGHYAFEKGGWGSSGKNTYRTGASPENPLPAPTDRSKLKGQTYYSTPKGTLLYLGNGKWQVPEAPSAGGASGAGGDAGDAGDEEEEEE